MGWNAKGAITSRGESDEDHKVDFQYVCTQPRADRTFSKWKATGTVESTSAGNCFPGDAIVFSKQGPKRMSQTRIGDELLAFSHGTGTAEFTRVWAWLHRDTNAEMKMIRFHTNVGDIVASASHSLAYDRQRNTFAFASDFRVGDMLVTPNGSYEVLTIMEVVRVGLYSPLTESFNIFVSSDSSPAAMFLAHNFAHVQQPWRLEVPFSAIVRVSELFFPSVHEIDDSIDTEYIHPVCRGLMYVFEKWSRKPRPRTVSFQAPLLRRLKVADVIKESSDIERSVASGLGAPLSQQPRPTPSPTPPPPPVSGALIGTVAGVPPFMLFDERRTLIA